MSTVMAIVTRVCNVDAPPLEHFGKLTSFFIEVINHASKHNCHVYILTVSDFNSSNHTMSGWVWRNNSWHYHRQAIPHVLYNRLTSRKLEKSADFQGMVDYLKTNHNTTMFNERYFTKWEIYQALQGDLEIIKHLPESHLYTGVHLLRSMLDRYGVVFLKPSFGSLGKGVIRVSKVNDGFMTQIPSINGSTVKLFPSIGSAALSIGTRTERRKYLIQRGIDLIKVNSKPLDIRALVQKDGTGEWIVSSMVARISYSEQSIVSNLARGGTLMTLREALSACTSFIGSKPTVASVRSTALEIAKSFDRNVEGSFGELGIDLAIDRTGSVWLLEINSKPNKADTTVLNQNATTSPRPSVVRLIQYARFLSGDFVIAPVDLSKRKKKRKQR